MKESKRQQTKGLSEKEPFNISSSAVALFEKNNCWTGWDSAYTTKHASTNFFYSSNIYKTFQFKMVTFSDS